ncbi:MAG: class I SAM-dependent methyltransferase [Actinobacteria bacterium]|nr:class I SAM-dependent methyltransferase [Actinomycetota bacterium]
MVATFVTPAAPTPEKLRGGYYTPDPVARFVAEWVAEAGPRLLEPSCGDGSILGHLVAHRPDGCVTGVELNELEARTAQKHVPAATVVDQDFFAWFSSSDCGSWDGVAGNPPFIRFQHWKEEMRDRAFDLMRSAGLRPTRLTNAWVPFSVAATLALREGGRVGLVLPAELLQVTYAAELRAFLVDTYAELTAVTFRTLLFDGVLQEVVLLLGIRGEGPAAIRLVEVDDAASLPSPPSRITRVAHAPALLHDREKWTRYFLSPGEIEALRDARTSPGIGTLGDVAEVDVGVVTGRNAFFVLKPSEADRIGVRAHCIPLVSKSAHVPGIRLSSEQLDELARADARCLLLAVPNDFELAQSDALRRYVEDGEASGVHLGYKCSIRKKWWVAPSVWTPDAFLLRQIYDHPRIVSNEAGATSTDTIHRIRVSAGIDHRVLAAASINSVTFAFSEVMGRSYGGGVLELEPNEAEALPFPAHEVLSSSEIDFAFVEELTLAGRLVDAIDYVDRVLLIDGLGMERDFVMRLRDVWSCLRDRRLARGRSTPGERRRAA